MCIRVGIKRARESVPESARLAHFQVLMSLWWRKETLAPAFQQKMPPPRAKVVIDKQTGSSIMSGEGVEDTTFEIPHLNL